MPRHVIDPGPFRYTQLKGPHRSPGEQFQVGQLLRRRGLQPARCEFALEEIPLIDTIESLIVEADEQGNSTFDYEAWRAEGAPEAPLRALYADSYAAARQRRPQDNPRLDKFTAMYANSEDVEPLVAMNSDRVLSSGDKALILLDGRHRAFAAAHAGVARLPVFVLLRSDAVFSY